VKDRRRLNESSLAINVLANVFERAGEKRMERCAPCGCLFNITTSENQTIATVLLGQRQLLLEFARQPLIIVVQESNPVFQPRLRTPTFRVSAKPRFSALTIVLSCKEPIA